MLNITFIFLSSTGIAKNTLTNETQQLSSTNWRHDSKCIQHLDDQYHITLEREVQLPKERKKI